MPILNAHKEVSMDQAVVKGRCAYRIPVVRGYGRNLHKNIL
ncbi:hypothetical protein CSC35_2231 [Enterobacter hormaechei]|nr:hypothetical protein CSC35_2231 [Enterobacter hormaechei]